VDLDTGRLLEVGDQRLSIVGRVRPDQVNRLPAARRRGAGAAAGRRRRWTPARRQQLLQQRPADKQSSPSQEGSPADLAPRIVLCHGICSFSIDDYILPKRKDAGFGRTTNDERRTQPGGPSSFVLRRPAPPRYLKSMALGTPARLAN